MKCSIPEISWHNREPVLSIDIHPLSEKFYRLATGGADCHVLIWQMVLTDNGAVHVDPLSDLTRHQRAVNSVRWSPSGQYLATADDDANIIVWQLKTDNIPLLEGETNDKEVWIVHKILRGHKEDIYDLSWSPDSSRLLSGSIDNSAILWDVKKGHNLNILTDHKGFVQGVAWDPKGRYLATISTDRICRIFDPTGKHVKARIHKGILPVPDNHTFSQKEVKYFHDDTFKSFFRRLAISPDGALLVAPSGYIEVDGLKEGLNATYIFAVNSWTRPAAILPSPRYATTVTRFCPLLFELHETGPDPLVALPYRMIFAVGTDHDVILYDTQQAAPFAHLQQIHYTRLTDLTWSPDGLLLIASSTDGYCSLITFVPGELGVRYVEPMLKSSTEINLNVSGCELLDHDDPILESAIIRKEDGDQEKDLVASPSFAKPKKPTLLEQWTMKSPKQQVEHQHATVTSATGGINNKDSTSEKCVRRIVPTRVVVPPCVVSKTNMFDSSIKPKQLVSVGDKVKTSEQTENITKSPLLNFLSKSNNTPPKQSRLSVQKSVATTAFVAPPDVIMDENEARDSWQCGKTDSKQSESMEMDDNECELSLQMEESTDDESQIVNKNVKVCEKVPPPSSANGKQNDEDKNHIVNENVNVTSAIIIENNTKIVNVPKRRIPLITLSSPKNKKK